MAIETESLQSPGWWFKRLFAQLVDRQDRYDRLDRYYRGDPDLPEGAQSAKASYRRFQAKSRTNFAQLVVEAVRERMVPVGFRTGSESDDLGDSDAWRIWQANGLDAAAPLVHRASLSMGDSYVIVGGPDSDGYPLITPEDPRQVITAHDPVLRRLTVAALKVFHDDVLQADRAYLYLPGAVWKASRRSPNPADPIVEDFRTWEWVSRTFGGWEWDTDTPERIPQPVVPVVRFGNRLDLAGCSLGEFEDVMDVLDRINHMLLQRLVIATVQAFRQRAVKGVPDRDSDGNLIDYNGIFASGPDALWLLPPDAEMWESQQVDLTPILTAVRHDVQDLAAVTRTPMHYLTPDAPNQSAEGASLAREGLVFKAQDRIVQAGESWEAVMALAFLFKGDESRGNRVDMETLWAPPAQFSLAERYDAASKAQASGVPWKTIMLSILQFSPQEVARMEAEREVDALIGAAQAPVMAPVPPTVPAPVP